jgi:hypothetical protein
MSNKPSGPPLVPPPTMRADHQAGAAAAAATTTKLPLCILCVHRAHIGRRSKILVRCMSVGPSLHLHRLETRRRRRGTTAATPPDSPGCGAGIAIHPFWIHPHRSCTIRAESGRAGRRGSALSGAAAAASPLSSLDERLPCGSFTR